MPSPGGFRSPFESEPTGPSAEKEKLARDRLATKEAKAAGTKTKPRILPGPKSAVAMATATASQKRDALKKKMVAVKSFEKVSWILKFG